MQYSEKASCLVTGQVCQPARLENKMFLKEKLVTWCFESSQPPWIISGLKETFQRET